jgi:hypothetical protein
VLDDFIVKRLIEGYTDEFGDLQKLYAEQLSRWEIPKLVKEGRAVVQRPGYGFLFPSRNSSPTSTSFLAGTAFRAPFN